MLDGLTTINDLAFENCSNLTYVVIPESVTSISLSAFSGSSSVTIYGYEGSVAQAYATANSIPFVTISTDSTTLSSAVALKTGISLSWIEVSGVTGYSVYRKTESNSYTLLETLTGVTNTSYKDTSCEYGVEYEYTVITHYKDSSVSYFSDFSTTNSLKETSYSHDFPMMISAETTRFSKSIRIYWEAVDDATSYAVYRRTIGSEWKLLGYTSNTTYLNRSAKTGVEYEYMVKAVFEDSSMSTYSELNILRAVTYCSDTTTSIESVTTKTEFNILWSQVDSATGYIIYRKAPGASSWRKLNGFMTTQLLLILILLVK